MAMLASRNGSFAEIDLAVKADGPARLRISLENGSGSSKTSLTIPVPAGYGEAFFRFAHRVLRYAE